MASAHRIPHRDRRTLDTIFGHPLAHNLAWSDALHLVERTGTVRQETNGRILLTIGEHRHVFHEPQAKQLGPEDVKQLRKFLELAGVTPDSVEVIEG